MPVGRVVPGAARAVLPPGVQAAAESPVVGPLVHKEARVGRRVEQGLDEQVRAVA